MPRGDGTGPPRSADQRDGRMKGSRPGAGPDGECICPHCGKKLPHRQAEPCYNLKCPQCGTKMVRA